MPRKPAQKTRLNFGHRLGMLRDILGFPINEKLTKCLRWGGVGENTNALDLDASTVSRWCGEQGGTSSCIDKEVLIRGLVDFIEKNNYLSILNCDSQSLKSALESPDDLDFMKILQGQTKGTMPPIPNSIRNLTPDRLDGLRQFGTGFYLLYRVGSAKREGSLDLLSVPVKISLPSDSSEIGVEWHENFDKNIAQGVMINMGNYTTVLGDDVDRVKGTADLFFVQLADFRSSDSTVECGGVLTMSGDKNNNVSAYTIWLCRVQDLPQQPKEIEQSWKKFCDEHSKRIPLTTEKGGLVLDANWKKNNEANSKKYSKVLKKVAVHPTDVLRD